jgi:hypothetical protein
VNPSLLARVGAMSVAILLVVSAAQAAGGDTPVVGGTNVWTMVGAPSFPTGGPYPVGVVSFSNHLAVAVSGIVIMVLRNNSSQTVYFSTGTVTIASGAIGAVELIEFGLAPGTYNATFFAFTFSGVAISLPTSALFALPG